MSPVLQMTSSRIRNEVLSHLLAMLQRTVIVNEPFTHCYFEQVFPEAMYPDLLAALPDTEQYGLSRTKSDDGYYTRRNFQLDAESLARLDEPGRSLWAGASAALCSSEYQQALFDKLSVGLARRFGIDESRVGQLKVYPRPALYRDLPGYEITPHPDTRKKIVTTQLFLPSDDSRPHLGTCLYRSRLESLRGLLSWGGRFERFKQFPFHANSGYAFVVTNSPLRPKSWHGCEKTPADGRVRDTLLHIYYSEPS
jgi:hypothetical protein